MKQLKRNKELFLNLNKKIFKLNSFAQVLSLREFTIEQMTTLYVDSPIINI